MSKGKEKEAIVDEKPVDEKQPEVSAQDTISPVAKIEPRNTAIVDYGDDAGAGFENQTQDDFGIPFIDILQWET